VRQLRTGEGALAALDADKAAALPLVNDKFDPDPCRSMYLAR
jgi:hypothetical protein